MLKLNSKIYDIVIGASNCTYNQLQVDSYEICKFLAKIKLKLKMSFFYI